MTIGQGDDCTTGCLLDYAYFKDNHSHLSQQKALEGLSHEPSFKELLDKNCGYTLYLRI